MLVPFNSLAALLDHTEPINVISLDFNKVLDGFLHKKILEKLRDLVDF